MSASTSQAWLQHYSDWTPHTLDYGDKTIVDYYRNNLRVNLLALTRRLLR